MPIIGPGPSPLGVLTIMLILASSLTSATDLCTEYLGTAPMRCNSMTELCNLKFNQVSFAGTHNSGSGFDGNVRQCDGSGNAVDDCIWRNQNLNITEQLNLGIRFLEIDLCLLPDNCNSSVYDTTGNSSLFTCYGRNGVFRYAGPMFKLIQQVNNWMLENPNEVIGLYFPNDSPEGEATQIFSELRTLLEAFWLCEEGTSSICMSTYFYQRKEWPTLSEAILMQERIFVFIDPEFNDASTIQWNHPSVFSTYVKPDQESNFCKERLLSLADLCNTTANILIEVGVTLGVCIDNGQNVCNTVLQNATEKCYGLRSVGIVNVVAVDFPDQTVLDVVDYLNKLNIAKYTNSFVTNSPPCNSSPTTEFMPGSSSTAITGSVYSVLILVVFLFHFL